MNIVSKTLNPMPTIGHLVDTLSQVDVAGTDVSSVLLNGSVYALVPDCTQDSRLYDFKHGGLVAPSEPSALSGNNVQPTVSTAEYLANQLVQFNGYDCLIHEPLKEVGEASAVDGEPIQIEGSIFYLNRHCLQSVTECERTVRRNTLSWHFLLLVGRYPHPLELSRKSIVQNAVCIVVGAYDGESYLVWRRD